MAIAFNTDFTPVYRRVDELSPLIRRVVAQNPNPFTFTGTGVYLIGRGEVAVIDPGPTLDTHLDAMIEALDPGESNTHILVTHTHTDHTAGVAKLVERTGATTYGFGPHGPVPEHDPLDSVSFDEYFTAEEKAEDREAVDRHARGTQARGSRRRLRPDVAVADGDVIEGDGLDRRGGAHAGPHLQPCVFRPPVEEKVLFTGDHVMGWATSVISPPDGDLFDYLSSLRKLLDRTTSATGRPTVRPSTTRRPTCRASSIIACSREPQIVAAL